MLGYIRPYRGRAAVAGIAVVAVSILQLAPALVLRELVNRLAAPRPHFAGVALIVALGAGALIAGSAVMIASNYLAAQISENIVFDLRRDLVDHLLRQSVGYFTRRRSGDILSNVMNDVNGVEVVLTQSLLTVIRSGCLLGAMVVLMVVLDWRLAALTLVVVPAVFVPFRFAGRAMYRSRRRVQEQLTEVTAFLHEKLGLSGIMLVKAFARQRTERARFQALNDELRSRQLHATMTARWFSAVMLMLQSGGPMIVLLVGGLFVTQGSTGLGTLIAFATIFLGQFATSVQSLGSAALSTAGSLAMWERIFNVLDEVPEVNDRLDAVTLAEVDGAIRFEGVSFVYPGSSRRALADVDVEIEAGQLVALVGPSGAGKTTFSALAARFMDPTSGRVVLDGRDLRDLTLESLHRHIGVVFQDPFLFHTTLRENVTYGRSDATEDEIWAALADANLATTMRELPQGLDTVVGERGHRLSGGEKQRVAIARVMLSDPRILLLDEATAHLDNVSERLIQAALQRLFMGRTSLVIAHRLSTIVAADLILVLEGGRIVERGTHAELLSADGLYARLHAGQALSATPS